MCLLAALDSQGIVVKCTAAIFFRTVDYVNGDCPMYRGGAVTGNQCTAQLRLRLHMGHLYPDNELHCVQNKSARRGGRWAPSMSYSVYLASGRAASM